MKIIEPSVEIYRESDHFKKIETIARVCTGTQDKVGTKPEFVENLLKRGHLSPLEHVRVAVPHKRYIELECEYKEWENEPYGYCDRTKKVFHQAPCAFINARDFIAIGGTLDELKDLPESDDYMTVKFTCDIGISRELCRHRQFSFMERSTRYVNMKDGIEFVRPVPFEWSVPDPSAMENDIFEHWKTNCIISERNYQWMIETGCSPQEARTVLHLSTATVLYVTGMISQWKDMLKLRLAKSAHPQMRYLMQMLVDLPDCPQELKDYAKEITA